jgi:hypothetical protein
LHVDSGLQGRLASRLTDTPKTGIRDRSDFGANTIIGASAVYASKARECQHESNHESRIASMSGETCAHLSIKPQAS